MKRYALLILVVFLLLLLIPLPALGILGGDKPPVSSSEGSSSGSFLPLRVPPRRRRMKTVSRC